MKFSRIPIPFGKSQKHTVHVFYRHTSHNTNHGNARPEWFSHELCLKNFLETTTGRQDPRLKVVLHFLFDGTLTDYESDFSSRLIGEYEQSEFFEVRAPEIFDGGSDKASILRAKEIIDKKFVRPNDYVYLLENDYLHTADWVSCLADLLNSAIPFDYVSLYDHGDKYPGTPGFLRRYTELRSRIFVTASRHWRTAPSTCFSFIVRKKTFIADWPLLNIGHADHVLFRVIREINKRILITPMPALSTHCMSAGISPVIDWCADFSNSPQL
jgi:hypothetical protein